jgi:eukaryotic translation initiation factor 2C
MQALNVVLRMELIQRYPFNTRSFFIPEGKKDVGYGLELWRGYFQSVRPAIGRILVTLDTATAMFWKHGPLIPICLEHLGRQGGDPNLLAPSRGFPDRMKVLLQRFLVNMRFSCEGPAGEKKYTIRGISKEGASSIKFERNG